MDQEAFVKAEEEKFTGIGFEILLKIMGYLQPKGER